MVKKTAPPKKISLPTQKDSPKIRNWAGIIYTIVSAIIIICGTYIAIRWANGDFRLDRSADLVATETGLLHATSTPKGAEVYIDGKLTSITDNTIYLSPGTYEVEIKMDGYSSWKKNILIEKSLVSQTNANLFPYSPSLSSLTFTGVSLPLPSPNGHKILFYLENSTAKNKNGLYVLDLQSGGRSPQQISDNDEAYNLATASYVWSPDSSDILVVTDKRTFLLPSNRFSNLQSSPDVELQLKTIFTSWEEDLATREKLFSEKKIHSEILRTILQNSVNAFLSPDNTKIFYTATAAATIPTGLMPVLPAPNSQPQERTLAANRMYVYDGYEDKNYFLGETTASSSAKTLLTAAWETKTNQTSSAPHKNWANLLTSLQAKTTKQTLAQFNNYYGNALTRQWQWLPNSTHLVGIVANQVVIMNYDGSNPTVIYSGPFDKNFLQPNYDSNSVLILTTFNPDSPPNLYAIELKR